MIPTVLFVGQKDSGKTTIVTQVIAELTRRGVRVGALKHTTHAIDLDQEGKDSQRMSDAGALMVGVISKGMTGFYRQTAEPWTPEDIRDRLFEGVDVMVGEGFKEARLPKIAIIRDQEGAKNGEIRKGLLAVVSDLDVDLGVNRFATSDISGIADLVQKQISRKQGKRDVLLWVNGKKVFIKSFIKDFILNTVVGMVVSLRDTEGAKSIVIRIQNADAKDTEE